MTPVRGNEQRLRSLALRSGGPSATARLLDDGTVRLTWLSDAMAELLDPAQEGRPAELADVLHGDSAARLTAVVRDLVRMDGRSASVAVTVQRGWPRQVWLRLQVQSPGRLRSFGRRPARHAAVHAEAAVRVAVPDEPTGGRAELAERLRQALHRRRRWSSRVAVAMVTALHEDVDGPLAVPLPATAELADRVRHAARGTDAVVVLAAGRFAVLAEDVATDGETSLARRVLAVLDRAAGDAGPIVVEVTVIEVADVDADPDAVIDALLRSDTRAGRIRGPIVLDPWTADARPAPGEDDELPPAAFDRRLRAALASGRFVPGLRRTAGENRTGGAMRTLSVIECCSVEEGVVSPVRVDAPGLAVALDRWLAEQVGASPPPAGDESRRVLVLQPGGELGSWLAGGVPEAGVDPGGDRLVVAVPEGRLLAALTAERAVLREMALREVPLAVAEWSGLIDVPTLVRNGIGLVLLAPETQRAVLRPDGIALLAGLLAGLRAGLGPSAVVVALDPDEGSVTSALEACGIVCAVSSPTVMMAAT